MSIKRHEYPFILIQYINFLKYFEFLVPTFHETALSTYYGNIFLYVHMAWLR